MNLQDQLINPLMTDFQPSNHIQVIDSSLESQSQNEINLSLPIIETSYQLPTSDSFGSPLIIQSFTECLVNNQQKLSQLKQFIQKYDNTAPFPLQQALVQSFIQLMVTESALVYSTIYYINTHPQLTSYVGSLL